MTLTDVNKLFGTDARCRELLKRLRWPAGVECPRCHDTRVSWIATQEKFECSGCRYQFTVTAGTIFHDSHLPLTSWFLVTYLLCESRKGMSANQIKRTLGVSYKTAWYLCHRIRAAMAQVDRPMLDGTIEMDETYVGGRKRAGMTLAEAYHAKQTVIGIRQRNGELRFFHAADATRKTLTKYIQANISEDVDVIITDELPAYKGAVGKFKHEAVNHSRKEYVRLGTDIHTNTVESSFSLLKRGIVGTWHKISAKHLQAYLDEMCFRFDRRNDPNLFVDTLRHMIAADPLTFEQLTAPKLKFPLPAQSNSISEVF